MTFLLNYIVLIDWLFKVLLRNNMQIIWMYRNRNFFILFHSAKLKVIKWVFNRHGILTPTVLQVL